MGAEPPMTTFALFFAALGPLEGGVRFKKSVKFAATRPFSLGCAKDGTETPESEDGVADAGFDGAGEAGSEDVAFRSADRRSALTAADTLEVHKASAFASASGVLRTAFTCKRQRVPGGNSNCAGDLSKLCLLTSSASASHQRTSKPLCASLMSDGAASQSKSHDSRTEPEFRDVSFLRKAPVRPGHKAPCKPLVPHLQLRRLPTAEP